MYRVYGRVHGRSRRVRTVYTGVQGPCTWCVHGRIQGTPTRSCTLYTAVLTARAHGRPRPCTDCVHGRARATYMVRPWPDHGRVRGPYTAVYREHGRLYSPCARHCTYRVHGRLQRLRIVFTGMQGPCTCCVHCRVQVHLHGRVLCTRPCLRPVYMAAHGRTRPCTGHVHGPPVTRSRLCTMSVHGSVP